MANSADSSQTVQGRYVQPRAVYLRKRALELTLLAMLLFGGVGAGVSSVFWIDTNPSVSRWNWLLPLIAVAAVLEVLLLKGPELVRHRFVVDESGFTPPFFRSARQRSGGETTIPFDWVDRVATRTYTQAGRTRVYGIALALKDGRRVVIRESDVGEDGIRRLSTALSVARPSSGGSTDSERPRQTDQAQRMRLASSLQEDDHPNRFLANRPQAHMSRLLRQSPNFGRPLSGACGVWPIHLRTVGCVHRLSWPCIRPLHEGACAGLRGDVDSFFSPRPRSVIHDLAEGLGG